MKYNGHKNWNHWNVSLWINNDEALYVRAIELVRQERTRDKAAAEFLDFLHEAGLTKTPDGATYTLSSIRAAMVGM